MENAIKESLLSISQGVGEGEDIAYNWRHILQLDIQPLPCDHFLNLPYTILFTPTNLEENRKKIHTAIDFHLGNKQTSQEVPAIL